MTNDELVKRLREDQPVTQDMESTMQCALLPVLHHAANGVAEIGRNNVAATGVILTLPAVQVGQEFSIQDEPVALIEEPEAE